MIVHIYYSASWIILKNKFFYLKNYNLKFVEYTPYDVKASCRTFYLMLIFYFWANNAKFLLLEHSRQPFCQPQPTIVDIYHIWTILGNAIFFRAYSFNDICLFIFFTLLTINKKLERNSVLKKLNIYIHRSISIVQ